jgi:anthranilate phosphoribosyltransferase
MLNEALAGKEGPARDVVALNAGAALYAAGLEDSLARGVERAVEVLSAGVARETLARLVEKTHSFAGETR